MEVFVSSAPQGLAPCEGLELELMKLGCTSPPLGPRRRPQAGKSGDPRSQNANSSPWAQGALRLGLAEKRRGKCGALQAPSACGLRRGSRSGPVRPIFVKISSRPSQGAKPHGVNDRKLPQEQPHQAGSRGGGEIKARAPRKDPVMQAMTIETRRAPGGRQPAQCPRFLFGAKWESVGTEYRGIKQRLPFRCNDSVITSVFGS